MSANEPVRNEWDVICEMFHILKHFMIMKHDQLPTSVAQIAQLVRASHRFREVTDSNLVEVLTFSGFYTQWFKLRS